MKWSIILISSLISVFAHAIGNYVTGEIVDDTLVYNLTADDEKRGFVVLAHLSPGDRPVLNLVFCLSSEEEAKKAAAIAGGIQLVPGAKLFVKTNLEAKINKEAKIQSKFMKVECHASPSV